MHRAPPVEGLREPSKLRHLHSLDYDISRSLLGVERLAKLAAQAAPTGTPPSPRYDATEIDAGRFYALQPRAAPEGLSSLGADFSPRGGSTHSLVACGGPTPGWGIRLLLPPRVHSRADNAAARRPRELMGQQLEGAAADGVFAPASPRGYVDSGTARFRYALRPALLVGNDATTPGSTPAPTSSYRRPRAPQSPRSSSALATSHEKSVDRKVAEAREEREELRTRLRHRREAEVRAHRAGGRNALKANVHALTPRGAAELAAKRAATRERHTLALARAAKLSADRIPVEHA
eukprot:CAMPEP_0180039748 /NCGR_PEP_ID=MMETSP0984-20121128/33029_1 /TAXON_ID=483367 /ORGANISM="non described non described, Strain CCMP 2436" /LENGTH=291 /DNA_ID=CAMNT_0021966817 /DNA_START=1 /DNA_END=877 /DNA_ORIENTATION=+